MGHYNILDTTLISVMRINKGQYILQPTLNLY